MENLQKFLNLKFQRMSENINKLNFSSVYSVLMGGIAFRPFKSEYTD